MSGPLIVFGANGQLGSELRARAPSEGLDLIGVSRTEVDIADPAAVETALRRFSPSIIVNAAAYTAVDKAESDLAGAETGNVVGPRILAAAAARHGKPLVHISTDYVFDGTLDRPYVETDPIAPLGVYGKTKAAGEAAVRDETAQHVILRTAWVYGRYGANFLKTMLRLAKDRDELRVVADQVGSPTSTADLAAAIFAIARENQAGGMTCGTFHFAGTGDVSWHGFAEAIVAAQAPFTGRRPPVRAIATVDYPTPARRPANSRLDCTRFAEAFGFRAAPWPLRVTETVSALFSERDR